MNIEKYYNEPHRHYHTWNHVLNCLSEMYTCAHLLDNVEEVRFALMFHDAVYNTRTNTNEYDSSKIALKELKDYDNHECSIQNVVDLILATTHYSIYINTNDEKYIADIDLSILGQPPEVYEQYAKDIRKEYYWYSKGAFKKGRAQLLTLLLDNDHIYHTQFFRDKYEKQALSNITKEIFDLEGVKD